MILLPMLLSGPFSQVVTMDKLPEKGSLTDDQLEIIEEAGIVTQDGKITETGNYKDLLAKYHKFHPELQPIKEKLVVLPGFIDPHTHLCWAGSREKDYALRLQGKSYSEIAQSGGGIWDTVTKTRQASDEELLQLLGSRLQRLIKQGITTCEVKSGYALSVAGEIRLLEIIQKAGNQSPVDLLSTCLAAHIKPRDFQGSSKEYLLMLERTLFPFLKAKQLTNRMDIFVEEGAFGREEAGMYLHAARKAGFDLVVHGEQFTSGGVELAVELRTRSVDHLEMIDADNIAKLAQSEVVAIALPGASMGLGCRFAPARKLLDAGCCLAIGSDWNPGSAPMGDLLVQTAVLGAAERMTNAESFAAITVRAAIALGLNDRGVISFGKKADFIGFQVDDYREITYHQGMLKPSCIWKNGVQIQI